MRLLTMLATAVLLAGCIYDTEDFTLFVAERGASLTYYIGSSEKSGGDHDDPWHRILENFGSESVHRGKSEEDPWNRISEMLPLESGHTGKADIRNPWGCKKSRTVFVSLSYKGSAADRARVTEVRGRMLKLEFADGVEEYVIDAPASWREGTQLETGFVGATSKKHLPFTGVRFWRTVKG